VRPVIENVMPKTQKTMQLMFDEHVRYEIDHLSGMYRLLTELPNNQLPDLDRKMIDDALIVAFCIHAKNLMEFLSDRPKKNYAVAVEFAADGYKPWKIKRSREGRLKGKLNSQISHLTYARTEDPNEKIGPQDRKELVKRIYDELVRWSNHLKPSYDANKLNLKALETAKEMEIKAGVLATASLPASLTVVPNFIGPPKR
jgi:hypothetical protein